MTFDPATGSTVEYTSCQRCITYLKAVKLATRSNAPRARLGAWFLPEGDEVIGENALARELLQFLTFHFLASANSISNRSASRFLSDFARGQFPRPLASVGAQNSATARKPPHQSLPTRSVTPERRRPQNVTRARATCAFTYAMKSAEESIPLTA